MMIQANKFSELDVITKLIVANEYRKGWKVTHNEVLSLANAEKCCMDLEDETYYKDNGDIIEDLDEVMGKCKVCGLEFTKLDYINASNGVVGDECLVGDHDDICSVCEVKQDDEDYDEVQK